MDEKYTYNGKEYSRADLEAKYGDKVDDAISKFGFELVQKSDKSDSDKEQVYSYGGVDYTQSQLNDKYGDKVNQAIEKFGIKKKDSTQPVQTQPAQTQPVQAQEAATQEGPLLGLGAVSEQATISPSVGVDESELLGKSSFDDLKESIQNPLVKSKERARRQQAEPESSLNVLRTEKFVPYTEENLEDEEYKNWKSTLPENLQQETEEYDLYGAYKSGMQPVEVAPGEYHMSSRDPKTGKILKSEDHETFSESVIEDDKLGYVTYKSNDGNIYSKKQYEIDIAGDAKEIFRVDDTGAIVKESVAGGKDPVSDVQRGADKRKLDLEIDTQSLLTLGDNLFDEEYMSSNNVIDKYAPKEITRKGATGGPGGLQVYEETVRDQEKEDRYNHALNEAKKSILQEKIYGLTEAGETFIDDAESDIDKSMNSFLESVKYADGAGKEYRSTFDKLMTPKLVKKKSENIYEMLLPDHVAGAEMMLEESIHEWVESNSEDMGISDEAKKMAKSRIKDEYKERKRLEEAANSVAKETGLDIDEVISDGKKIVQEIDSYEKQLKSIYIPYEVKAKKAQQRMTLEFEQVQDRVVDRISNSQEYKDLISEYQTKVNSGEITAEEANSAVSQKTNIMLSGSPEAVELQRKYKGVLSSYDSELKKKTEAIYGDIESSLNELKGLSTKDENYRKKLLAKIKEMHKAEQSEIDSDYKKLSFGGLSATDSDTKLSRAMYSGLGDMVSGLAGGIEYKFGETELTRKLTSINNQLKSDNPMIDIGEFGFKEFFEDPFNEDWWATRVAPSAPMTFSLMVPGLGVGAGSAALATRIGLTGLSRALVAGTVSGVGMRASESFTEAGLHYYDMIERGESVKYASKEAAKTYSENMNLLGLDVLEMTTFFLPAASRAVTLGKFIAQVPLNMAEELIQEGLPAQELAYNRYLKGDLTPKEIADGVSEYEKVFSGGTFSDMYNFLQTPQGQEVALIGGIYGGAFGGASLPGDIKRVNSQRKLNNFLNEEIVKYSSTEITKTSGSYRINPETNELELVAESKPLEFGRGGVVRGPNETMQEAKNRRIWQLKATLDEMQMKGLINEDDAKLGKKQVDFAFGVADQMPVNLPLVTRGQLLQKLTEIRDLEEGLEGMTNETLIDAQKKKISKLKKESEEIIGGTAQGYFINNVSVTKEQFDKISSNSKFAEGVINGDINVTIMNDADTQKGFAEKIEGYKTGKEELKVLDKNERIEKALAILEPIASAREELTADQLTEVSEILGEELAGELISDQISKAPDAVELYNLLDDNKVKIDDTQVTEQEGVGTEEQVGEERAGQVQEPEVSQEEGATDPVLQEEVEDATEEIVEGIKSKVNQSKDDAKTKRRKRKALGAVSNILNFKSNILPDTKVKVHETDESYRAATGVDGPGVYDATNDTIHINLAHKEAGDETVYHEMIHPIIYSAVKNETEARILTQRMVEGIVRSSGGNKAIVDKLKGWLEQYESAERPEETIAEVASIIASEFKNLGVSAKNIIKDYINRMARKFGGKNLFRAVSKDADVVKVLNRLSEAMRAGEAITAEDLTSGDFSIVLNQEKTSDLFDMSLEEMSEEYGSEPGGIIGGGLKQRISGMNNLKDSSFNTSYNYGTKLNMPEPRTVESVIEESGGAAIFINSDGTGVFVSKDGKNLQGGWRYLYFDENISKDVGFAATSGQHVNTFYDKAERIINYRDSKFPKQKGKPIATFVTIQNAESMLGEWYAGEFFMEGIDKAITNGKIEGGLDGARSLLIEAAEKINKNGSKEFIELVNSKSFETKKGRLEIAKKLASKDFSFGFRSDFFNSISPLKTISKLNTELKKALRDVNHGRVDFYDTYTDEVLLEKLKNSNYNEKSIGGITLGGFFTDLSKSKKEFFDNRTSGLNHEMFNESFTSNGKTFLLDGGYNVNEMFPEMSFPTKNGYELYNKENNTNYSKEDAKKSPEIQFEISKFLLNKKEPFKNKLLANPFTSIAGTMYTSIAVPTGKQRKASPEKFVSELEKTKDSDPTQYSIKEVFKKTPELSKIGTEKQYSEYIDTVFPKSKVKDIVFHGGNAGIEQFSKERLGEKTQAESSKMGFFFSGNEDVSLTYIQKTYLTEVGKLKSFIDDYNNKVSKAKEEYDDKSSEYFRLLNEADKILNKIIDFIKKLTNHEYVSNNKKLKNALEIKRKKYENFDILERQKYKEEKKFIRENINIKDINDFFDNYKVASYKEEGKELYSVLLDIRNPLKVDFSNDPRDSGNYYSSELKKAINQNKDGSIIENTFDIGEFVSSREFYTEGKGWNKMVSKDQSIFDKYTGTDYVVFEPEQIHILGSKKDVKGFNDFVKETPTAKKPGVKERKAISAHEETGFISTDFWVDNLRGKTKYLDDVVENILESREELKKGSVSLGKVTRAYLVTIGSVGSRGSYYESWSKKTGSTVDDIFLEKEKGREWIRPEGATAAYLVTNEGKKLVKDIGSGEATYDQVKKLFDFADFGLSNKKIEYVMDAISKGGIQSFEELLNKNKGKDFNQIYSSAIKNLPGIAKGKTGFINQFFGVSTRGVIDARQLNAWAGGSMKLTDPQKQLRKKIQSSDALKSELLNRIEKVGLDLGYSEDIAAYIAHHAIWDKVANTITSHKGEYKVVSGKQRKASAPDQKVRASIDFQNRYGKYFTISRDFNNEKHLNNYIDFMERKGNKEVGTNTFPIGLKERKGKPVKFRKPKVKSALETSIDKNVKGGIEKETKSLKTDLKNARRNFIDFRGDIKDLTKTQKELEGVYERIITSLGSNGVAKLSFDKAYEQIYDGLGPKQRDALDKVIIARRIIAVNENRAVNNVDAIEDLFNNVPEFFNKKGGDYVTSFQQTMVDISNTVSNTPLEKDTIIDEALTLMSLMPVMYTGIEKAAQDKILKELKKELKSKLKSENVTFSDEKGNPHGLNAAYELLDAKRDELGDELYDKIDKRADKYFEKFQEMLEQDLADGIVSQDQYNAMKGIDYSPRVFVQFIYGIDNEIINNASEADNVNGVLSSTFGLNKDAIRTLRDGVRDDDLDGVFFKMITNSEVLLGNYINSRERLRKMNDLNSYTFGQLADLEQKFSDLKSKSKLTKEERIEFETLKETFDAFSIKRKKGYLPVNFYEEGVKKKFYIRGDLYSQWYNLRPDLSIKLNAVDKVLHSPIGILKTFATGVLSPLFGITASVIDLTQLMVFSDAKGFGFGPGKMKSLTGEMIPVKAAQIAKDLVGVPFFQKGVITSILQEDELFVEAVNEGIMMDFLYTQGNMNIVKSMLKTGIETALEKTELGFGGYIKSKKALLKLAELTLIFNKMAELAPRLVAYQRTRDFEYAKVDKMLKDDSISKEEAEQMRKNARVKAAAIARELMNFAEGGEVTKGFVDRYSIYFNPAMQGTVTAARQAKENPIRTTSRAAQTAAMFSGVVLGLGLALPAMLKDDDDDKEINEIIKETRDNASPYIKEKYFLIPTGKKDEDGNYTSIRLKKHPQMVPFYELFEIGYDNYLNGDDATAAVSKENALRILHVFFDNALPVNVFPVDKEGNWRGKTILAEPFQRNPMLGGGLELITGYDIYRNKMIEPQTFNNKNADQAVKGLLNPYTEDFYKSFALEMQDATGASLSPAEYKHFVERMITNPRNNIYVATGYALLNQASDLDISKKDKSFFEDAFSMVSKKLIYSSASKKGISKTKDSEFMDDYRAIDNKTSLIRESARKIAQEVTKEGGLIKIRSDEERKVMLKEAFDKFEETLKVVAETYPEMEMDPEVTANEWASYLANKIVLEAIPVDELNMRKYQEILSEPYGQYKYQKQALLFAHEFTKNGVMINPTSEDFILILDQMDKIAKNSNKNFMANEFSTEYMYLYGQKTGTITTESQINKAMKKYRMK